MGFSPSEQSDFIGFTVPQGLRQRNFGTTIIGRGQSIFPGINEMLHSLVLVWPRVVIVAPVIAMSLGLSQDLYGSLVLCLLVGTPAISLIGLVGAALTVALGRGGALLSLLILPIMFPVVIFGGGSIDSIVMSGEFGGGLIWLFATSMLALGVAPIATLFALRLSIEI